MSLQLQHGPYSSLISYFWRLVGKKTCSSRPLHKPPFFFEETTSLHSLGILQTNLHSMGIWWRPLLFKFVGYSLCVCLYHPHWALHVLCCCRLPPWRLHSHASTLSGDSIPTWVDALICSMFVDIILWWTIWYSEQCCLNLNLYLKFDLSCLNSCNWIMVICINF